MEVGDKIVCISDGNGGGNVFDLEVGEIYTIHKILKGRIFNSYTLMESDYTWESYRFVSPLFYREMKIKKIKKCLNRMKK